MKVKLLQSYPDESVAYRASGICIGKEGSEKGMKSALSQGHMSIIEHLPMTFEIRGISRACSHQLVRHRLASYSQESQRYVDYKVPADDFLRVLKDFRDYDEGRDFDFGLVLDFEEKYFVVPPELNIKTNFIAYMSFMKTSIKVLADYCILRNKSSIKEEDARFLLPNAMKTNIIVSCNARSFIEQCNERLCEQAQWEIRAMYEAMKETIKDVYPTVYSYAKPKCAKCKETRPCSRKTLTKGEKIEHAHLRG